MSDLWKSRRVGLESSERRYDPGSYLPPAPGEIMDLIFCFCKNGCSTLQCSCVKSGILCSPACKTCEGVSCSNSDLDKGTPPEEDDDKSDLGELEESISC
ncbi:hypothetical protein O0L34_g5840 [Tuta absoluta]|nr:hypothetical protein O0L34_g5840 [Tuta absoluta]